MIGRNRNKINLEQGRFVKKRRIKNDTKNKVNRDLNL